MGKLTALIDGDILVYQAALEAEHEHRWDDGLWTYHADEEHAKAGFQGLLTGILEEVKATDFMIALTDSERNWRLDVLPTYKGNRKGVRRPLLRKYLNDWVQAEFADKAFLRPRLEGDDVLGILATHPKIVPGDKVVVSIDKDFKTIPGKHYNQKHKTFFEINEEEADWWHMAQTVSGDATDGYAGCPGVGVERAAAFLNAPYLSVPYDHTITRGSRKGEVEVRYREEPTDDVWAAVVSLYESKGLNEEAALTQARVARILRHTDYDFDMRKPILWNPKKTHLK